MHFYGIEFNRTEQSEETSISNTREIILQLNSSLNDPHRSAMRITLRFNQLQVELLFIV